MQYRGLHLIHLPTISIDGETASGRAHFRFESMQHAEGLCEMGAVPGIYTIAYVSTPQGWKIRHRAERAMSRERSSFYPGF